ncbi:energy transducer TonB [Gluconobacter sp. OJB]|uniref:energy transducer TonB n=1 Tax=Gluconobacter sp. OJB TaxID=3145196 RepID=UPI0031F7BE40
MKRLLLALPALFLTNCPLLAATPPDHPARLNQEISPTYPMEMVEANQVGVMELTFDVQPDGTVRNVRAFGTMTPQQIRSSLSNISHLRYDPAVVGGQPVEEKNVHKEVRLALDNPDVSMLEANSFACDVTDKGILENCSSPLPPKPAMFMGRPLVDSINGWQVSARHQEGHPVRGHQIFTVAVAATRQSPLPAPVSEIDPSWNVHAFIQSCPSDRTHMLCQIIPLEVSGNHYRLPAGASLPGNMPEELIIGLR